MAAVIHAVLRHSADPPPGPPSAAGDYPRQSIAVDMTPGNDYGWIGKGATPVTYSLTIADYPAPAYAGFQTHVFLTPSYGTENAPDWNQPNVVFLELNQDTNGVARAVFRYKVNAPNNNTTPTPPTVRSVNWAPSIAPPARSGRGV